MKILVTGPDGFVGKALVERLIDSGHEVILAGRRQIGDIETAPWDNILPGVQAIAHLAARVHQMKDQAQDPLAAFRAVNRDATARLARAAKKHGIKRFVFLSSVKAAIDKTDAGGVDETMPPAPQSAYGISKLEAERELLSMPEIGPVILRPPLIYGLGAKGNFATLTKLIRWGVPLPVGGIDNRRSFLGLGNLVSAIELALTVEHIEGEVFYLADDNPLTTAQLAGAIAAATGNKSRIISMNQKYLAMVSNLFFQKQRFARISQSLVVKNDKFKNAAQWQPRIPMAEELAPARHGLYVSSEDHMEIATFGAGCFWGVEEEFRNVEGVTDTAVGYLGGDVENPTYKQVCTDTTGHAEVMQVTFDPAKVSYAKLVEKFWTIHDPTQVNRQGPDYGRQYRTAIFYHSPEQKRIAEEQKAELEASGKFRKPIATEITPANTFWKAEEYHQQYLAKRGQSHCAI